MASAAAATPQRLNQAGLARDLGVSRQAISDLIKRQIIPISADGLIDVEVARMAIASRVRPSGKTNASAAPPPSTAPDAAAPPGQEHGADAQLSYHVAKTLREAAEAKIAQLKLAEMRGDLVRADEIRASLSKRAASFREGLLQIPSRLSAQLAAETNQAAVHALLDAELRTVMAQLTAGT